MCKRDMVVNVEAPLAALEKSGCVAGDEKTAALIMAAVVANAFRSFESMTVFRLPLTGNVMRVTARVDVSDDVEVTEGEFKPEVPHG